MPNRDAASQFSMVSRAPPGKGSSADMIRPYILIIDDNDDRRVETLRYLLRCYWPARVTPCSSLYEAAEITQHFGYTAKPQIVIMPDHYQREGGLQFRKELDERFSNIHWILCPCNADIFWLAEMVGSIAEDLSMGAEPMT
jgi:hypothetical protein